MGQSNSIEQQKKLNAEFQAYIETQTAALDKMSDDALTVINTSIDKYYKDGKWDDAKPLIFGKYEHITTASEWSLDNIVKMIDSVKNAIFGAPAPAGSTAPPQSSDLAQNVMKMSEMDLLIASAALNAIQGILSAFTSGTQTSVQKDFATKVLAPGLTMFLCVIDNQYHRSDFFTDNTISQTAYIFETRFSSKQAADSANFELVQSLIAEQHASEALVAQFNDAIKALKITDEDFDAKNTKYTASREVQNLQIEALRVKIAALNNAVAA